MGGESQLETERTVYFWTKHEGAVASAGVSLSIHLRDILRRPACADVDGVGSFERVEALLRYGDVIQRAVADVLEASDDLPESQENNEAFQVALCALNTAVFPATLEFFEAPDLCEASASAEFVETAVLVACSVLSTFASLQIGVHEERMAKAFATAIGFMDVRRTAQCFAEDDDGALTSIRLVNADEVLEFAVPGIATLLESNSAYAAHVTCVAPKIAKYTAAKCGALHDKALTAEAKALAETQASVAVHTLRLLIEEIPSLAFVRDVAKHISAAAWSWEAGSRGNGKPDVDIDLKVLTDFCGTLD
jgi:hypothetical protein